MEGSVLKLTVEKGPREGETLELKPGSKKIRIGRVVKGNTFTIKDEGISSKHLVVESKDSKWVVCDLDTSNGTFLNGVQLEANTASDLKDGDLIKIGELTSIKVSIVEEKEELNPKQAKGGLKKVGKVRAAAASVEEVKEVDLENGVGPLRRSKRGAAATKGQQISESSLVSVNKNQKIRGKTKQEIVPSFVEIGGRRGGRKRAATSKDEYLETVSAAVSEMDIVEKDEVIRNSPSEPSHSAPVSVSVSVSGDLKVNDRSKLEKETCDESNNVPAHAEKLDRLKMTMEQLKKMTLGEWFDFMEVYLVKKIHDETDEIIAGMRERDEQFKKFMSEQQNLKDRSPLS